MPGFNGSGTFVRTYDWTQDAANAIPILAVRFDTEDDGFAAGLSNCICKDGQTVVTADIPFANHKLTGVADPVSATDALNLQSGDALYGETRGSFTGTLTGMVGTVTTTIQYVLSPNVVVLYIPGQTGTSNATTFTITGIPAAIQGTLGTAQSFAIPFITDNGSAIYSGAYVTLSAAQTILTFVINGSSSGFTNSGVKGLPGSITLTYKLK